MDASARFALAGIASALTAANVVTPVARNGPLSVPAFAFAMVPSELPVPSAAVNLVAAASLARRRGSVRGWKGALGVAAFAVAIACYAVADRRMRRAGDVLELALAEGLGPGREDAVAETFVTRPHVPLTLRRVLVPPTGMRRRYRTAADIAYGDAGRRNLLDVWKRSDLPQDGRAPVLVQVHGSGWTVGRKEGQAEPLMAHLAERGWICVTANYRLSPRATWPDHIVDVKRVIAWTKANVASYGGDPDFVVVTGGSAGGHLASLAALTAGLTEFQPGFEDADTSVAAAVPFYGVYDLANVSGAARTDMHDFLERVVFKTSLEEDRATWERAGSITHVSPEAPPFFVIHGSNDTLTPPSAARAFVAALREVSRQPVVYAELPGAQHAFDTFASLRTHETVNAVERFLAVVRSEHAAATG